MSMFKFMRFFVAPVLRLFWPTTVVGKENFDAVPGGAVVICNHYGIPDSIIPVVKLFKKELNVLAKSEAFKSKIGAWFLNGIGAIPVKRGEPDMHAYKEMMKRLKAEKKLLIFPEGTRNKEGTKDMAEFKNGAALFAIRSGKPIIPMLYYRKHKVLRRNFLFVGEAFDLSQFAGKKPVEFMDEANELVYNKMLELRAEMDDYVENKKYKNKETKRKHV